VCQDGRVSTSGRIARTTARTAAATAADTPDHTTHRCLRRPARRCAPTRRSSRVAATASTRYRVAGAGMSGIMPEGMRSRPWRATAAGGGGGPWRNPRRDKRPWYQPAETSHLERSSLPTVLRRGCPTVDASRGCRSIDGDVTAVQATGPGVETVAPGSCEQVGSSVSRVEASQDAVTVDSLTENRRHGAAMAGTGAPDWVCRCTVTMQSSRRLASRWSRSAWLVTVTEIVA
jgi:hypothetical protein